MWHLYPDTIFRGPLQLLKKQVFKSICGYYWYVRLRGWEIDAVDFGRKSYGQSYALGKKTADPQELARLLMKLTEKWEDGPASSVQETLFDTAGAKQRKVSDALDSINDKYGEFVITPALMMGMDDLIIDRIAFGGVKDLEEVYS